MELPSGCVLKGNTDVRGVATVANGDTTKAVAFPHEQAAAPTVVLITPTTDPGDETWVTDLATTGFTINVGTAVGADVVFMWLALW